MSVEEKERERIERIRTIPFSVKSKDYEVFFAEDGAIEVYEKNDPGSTGFIFEDRKRFNLFLNILTDVA